MAFRFSARHPLNAKVLHAARDLHQSLPWDARAQDFQKIRRRRAGELRQQRVEMEDPDGVPLVDVDDLSDFEEYFDRIMYVASAVECERPFFGSPSSCARFFLPPFGLQGLTLQTRKTLVGGCREQAT